MSPAEVPEKSKASLENTFFPNLHVGHNYFLFFFFFFLLCVHICGFFLFLLFEVKITSFL